MIHQQSSDRPSWPGGVAAAVRKSRDSYLNAADGVVDQKRLSSGSTTPSARSKEASRSLVGRAATPPGKEGRSSWIAVFLVALALLALLQTPGYSQCALCVTALEQSPEGRAMAASFNRGILFLLAAPYAIFGTISVVVFRAYRKRKAQALRDNPYIPKK